MTRIHWVPRQNKLETPKEKDEVNKREVHEYDVRTRDPGAMVVPPTHKTKASYRSMGTTGDPVTGRPAGRTGEPLHRLEPVPVNHFTG